MKLLSKKTFSFREIEKPFQENFVCASGNLSNAYVALICWVAEVYAEKQPVIYCDNNAWYDDEKTGKRFSVYLTENGNLCLKNWDDEKLFVFDNFNN